MPLPLEQTYTLMDYMEWPEEYRYEIINGDAYMQASPKRYTNRL